MIFQKFLHEHLSILSPLISAIAGFLLFAIFVSNDASAITLTVQVLGSVVATSTTPGQAELSSGTTAVELSAVAFFDVSSGVALASAGLITIGGVEKTLSNFTSGNLSGVNLSLAQSIGGHSFTIEQAVKLKSGIDSQPFTIINTSLSSFIVTIPDATAVLAPTGWDGTIAPPKTGSSAGTAPSGFSIGGTVIEIGSSNIVLLFDKSIEVILAGVTGNVGYKPSGSSTWTRIISTCGGTYASPSSPTFPGECSISNGSDTKISTYHLTTFAKLDAVEQQTETTKTTSSGGGGGGGGGGGYIPPPTGVAFSGKAYPKSTITLLKDAQIAAITIADANANFQISISGLSSGNFIFSVYSEDSKGNRSSLLTFPISVTSGITTQTGGIFIAPTIAVDKEEVKKGDNIAIFGQSAPKADVTIAINSDEEFFDKTLADANGVYLYNFDTTQLDMGQHFTKSKAALAGAISSFSKAVGFAVGTKNITAELPKTVAKGDLNNDRRVNLVDFSIAAYWYKRSSPPATADLNGDGKVDLIDFSIMAFYWTG